MKVGKLLNSLNSFNFILAIIVCVSSVTLIIVGLNFFDLINFSKESLVQYDAELYQKIALNWYTEEYLYAFFPLFPFLWGFFKLSSIGVSFLNFSIYLLSSILIFSTFKKVEIHFKVFLITTPSIIFYIVPYTEGLFFLSSTLIIVGLYYKKIPLASLGFVLSGLIRPAITVFIPALLVLFFFKRKRSTLFLIFSSIIGLLVTVIIQYSASNEWFIFYSAQSIWDNSLGLPRLPLRTWSGDFITKIDGYSFIIGISSGFIVIYDFFSKKFELKQYEIFSLSYLFGMTLIVLLYREGSLFSLNRFLLSTPFFWTYLMFFKNRSYLFRKNLNKLLIYTSFISTIIWLGFFYSFGHIKKFLQFELISLIIIIQLIYLLSENQYSKKVFYYGVFGINMIFLSIFIYRYYNGLWIA